MPYGPLVVGLEVEEEVDVDNEPPLETVGKAVEYVGAVESRGKPVSVG